MGFTDWIAKLGLRGVVTKLDALEGCERDEGILNITDHSSGISNMTCVLSV